MSAWRDVDSDRRNIGVVISAHGLSLYIGTRLYRVRWSR